MTGPASHRLRRTLTGAALAGTLLALTGCASSVDPIERLGRKAAERMGTRDGGTAVEVEVATVAEGTARSGGEPVRPEHPAHPAQPAHSDDLVRRAGRAD
ncbi:hypothetical protein ACIGW7_35325 [Streptomyces sp. NPDC053253]|uniref:hypothetical protein n=1 Tax=Streptomyces sp. NPDC053253 TaxID=3365699 RepID=UPI0037D1F15B